MKFEQIKDESSEGFRRLTGIKYTTFDVMVKIRGEAEAVLKAQGGKPISRSYGISESTCYRNIRWVEDTLIERPKKNKNTSTQARRKDIR